MTIEALAIALHHSRAKGTARLVMIGIANHDGDGGSWPAISTLQKYAGGVDRKTVKRAIDELERLHEVEQLTSRGGRPETPDHLRPNLYRVLLECPPDCDRTKNHKTRRGRSIPAQLELSTQGAWTPPGASDLSTQGAPAPRGEGAPTPPEPSLEPTTDREALATTDRARDRSSGCPSMAAEDGRHVISKRYGTCVLCGEVLAEPAPRRRRA